MFHLYYFASSPLFRLLFVSFFTFIQSHAPFVIFFLRLYTLLSFFFLSPSFSYFANFLHLFFILFLPLLGPSSLNIAWVKWVGFIYVVTCSLMFLSPLIAIPLLSSIILPITNQLFLGKRYSANALVKE